MNTMALTAEWRAAGQTERREPICHPLRYRFLKKNFPLRIQSPSRKTSLHFVLPSFHLLKAMQSFCPLTLQVP
jgi:hypothetical protein